MLQTIRTNTEIDELNALEPRFSVNPGAGTIDLLRMMREEGVEFATMVNSNRKYKGIVARSDIE